MLTIAFWLLIVLLVVGVYRIYGEPILTAFVLGLAGDSYADRKHDWE